MSLAAAAAVACKTRRAPAEQLAGDDPQRESRVNTNTEPRAAPATATPSAIGDHINGRPQRLSNPSAPKKDGDW